MQRAPARGPTSRSPAASAPPRTRSRRRRCQPTGPAWSSPAAGRRRRRDGRADRRRRLRDRALRRRVGRQRRLRGDRRAGRVLAQRGTQRPVRDRRVQRCGRQRPADGPDACREGVRAHRDPAARLLQHQGRRGVHAPAAGRHERLPGGRLLVHARRRRGGGGRRRRRAARPVGGRTASTPTATGRSTSTCRRWAPTRSTRTSSWRSTTCRATRSCSPPSTSSTQAFADAPVANPDGTTGHRPARRQRPGLDDEPAYGRGLGRRARDRDELPHVDVLGERRWAASTTGASSTC